MNIEPTNHHRENIYCRIHDFVTAELEGTATPDERRKFVDLICEDSDARQVYVQYMQEQASLRWSYANHPLDLVDAIEEAIPLRPVGPVGIAPQPRASERRLLPWAAAAAAVLATTAGTIWLAGQRLAAPPSTQVADQQQFADQQPIQVAELDDEPKSGGRPELDFGLGQPVATITRLIGVRWAPGAFAPVELGRLRTGDTLVLDAGQVELVFDTGVEVILEGPSHFEIRSADRAFCRRGAISARAGEGARGFTIETPNARVIDLGTEFGVSISESGETEVAVFRGIVDLALEPESDYPPGSTSKRLNQGEALRVGANGEFHRVYSIASDRFPAAAAKRVSDPGRLPLISEIRDNMREPESQKFYQIVRSGLVEDAPSFVDRVHQWNGLDERGLPSYLVGAEYVMPFNDDKQFSTRLKVTLFIARPATLFVFLSDAVEVPEWLKTEFIKTGEKIGLDEGPSRFHPARTGRRQLGVGTGKSVDTVFSIWKREVPRPAEVVLGGVSRPTPVTGFNMYGIAVVPLD